MFYRFKDFAFKLLDLGADLASGVVTFKKSHELANTFKKIPLDRILVETDAPGLAPEPLRGSRMNKFYCSSKVFINLKNTSFESFSKSTSQNFFNLFGNLN